jgi:hypothetical protein
MSEKAPERNAPPLSEDIRQRLAALLDALLNAPVPVPVPVRVRSRR